MRIRNTDLVAHPEAISETGFQEVASVTVGNQNAASSSRRPRGSRFFSLLVIVPIIFNLHGLWPTLSPVFYADDSSIHIVSTRFAANAFSSGAIPSFEWFPWLNLGSSRLLHYQPGASMVTGLTGLVVSPGTAYRLWLFVLMALWPIPVYLSVRILRLSPTAAGIAALLSPAISSNIGVGLEQHAYTWMGYGLFAQAFAMWLLPLAWALIYRSLDEHRYFGLCVAISIATIWFHFETGYLVIMAMIVLPFTRFRGLIIRVKESCLLLVGTLGGSLFIIVPLLMDSRFIAIDSTLARTGRVRGYGAGHDLTWLVTGQTFDHGRLPVLTCAVGLGVVVTIWHWRKMPAARAALSLGATSLLLSFGPTTLGSFAGVIPGHSDIYFRRFLVGVHLAGLWIAAFGISWAGARAASLLGRRGSQGSVRLIIPIASLTLVALIAIPSYSQLARLDQQNQAAVAKNRMAASKEGRALMQVAKLIDERGGGRAYAGTTVPHGISPPVGSVPAVMVLFQLGVDVVGMPPLSSSTMAQPEQLLGTPQLEELRLLGVRFLVTDRNHPPNFPVRLILATRPYFLYELRNSGYVSLQEPTHVLEEDKGNLKITARRVFSEPLSLHCLPEARWPGVAKSNPLGICRGRPPGVVLAQPHSIPTRGSATARVALSRAAVVTLSASFDTTWGVAVDGRREPIIPMAPATVGVLVQPGVHVVRFTHAGFPVALWISLLFLSIAIAATSSFFARRLFTQDGARIRNRGLVEVHRDSSQGASESEPCGAFRRASRPQDSPLGLTSPLVGPDQDGGVV